MLGALAVVDAVALAERIERVRPGRMATPPAPLNAGEQPDSAMAAIRQMLAEADPAKADLA